MAHLNGLRALPLLPIDSVQMSCLSTYFRRLRRKLTHEANYDGTTPPHPHVFRCRSHRFDKLCRSVDTTKHPKTNRADTVNRFSCMHFISAAALSWSVCVNGAGRPAERAIQAKRVSYDNNGKM